MRSLPVPRKEGVINRLRDFAAKLQESLAITKIVAEA
jgi:hypothetical protein